MNLGVCYYPEHWPEEQWSIDIEKMLRLGISHVRIGEFAWARYEPREGQFHWQWLHKILNLMDRGGLKVILGTPTATPPNWLIQKHPEILARDETGQLRMFGSRRHYCFSSEIYLSYCQNIVERMSQEFGEHPAVIAWQTDNEYGCHNTIRSYSQAAKFAFQKWCRQKYQEINNLNEAWGNVFWSMEYADFNDIDLPNLTATEANPSHWLDFYRFSSDQVVHFNRMQVDILRRHCPGRDLLHNYMGFFTRFDHFDLARDLDIATWDSYPLGFLRQFERDKQEQHVYFRTGHPDCSAFHHDLYRGVGKGRMWVMEQQPGPVNWADYNAVPLPGMVRLWTLEAFAHGAEVVSYFRWRQAPFAQEQFHAGLNLPNGDPSDVWNELEQLNEDLSILKSYDLSHKQADIALIFDYPSDWALRIARQGKSYDPLIWFYDIYKSLRSFGLNIDIISSSQSLDGYKLIVLPNLGICEESFIQKLKQFSGTIFLGPRSGSKTRALQIPSSLAPGALQDLIPIKITKVESLPENEVVYADIDGLSAQIRHWREWVSGPMEPLFKMEDGLGFFYQHENVFYLSSMMTIQSLSVLFKKLLSKIGIDLLPQESGLRIRRRGDLTFAFNYGPHTEEVLTGGDMIIGTRLLKPGDLAVWSSK